MRKSTTKNEKVRIKHSAPVTRRSQLFRFGYVGPKQKRQQAKLTVGQPNDNCEQEADRVADALMRMPEPAVVAD